MKKLFQKEEILFAVMWIVIYVLGFSNADMLSDVIGIPKLITVIVGAVISVILLVFVKRNDLLTYFGLCPACVAPKKVLFWLPLVAISSVNLLCGLVYPEDILSAVLGVICMCFVGFLEELIFRGFLFKAMCKNNVKVAILVSSLTFGAGHVINLLMGAPLLDTLLQLAYATAVGFCYTAIFYVSGSILPCILSHAVVNSLSVFVGTPTPLNLIVTAMIQIVLGVGYGLWLLRQKKCDDT